MPEHTFDEKRLARLDSPERRKLLPPEKILQLLDVKGDDTILDVGAGAGYFTFQLAEHTSGTVYALDLDKVMLDYIKKQMKARDVENIEGILGQAENIALEDQTVQRILASMVLHEVPSLEKTLTEIYRVLQSGGRFVCIDWLTNKDEQRPNRIHSSVMKETAEKVGFTYESLSTPSEFVYAIVFTKA